MVEPITINVRHPLHDVRLAQEQVQATVDLLDAGFPIPFIARYRKEVTKNLNEEVLREIDDELRSARLLCERKLAMLKTIDSAGKLTPELDKNIRDARSIKRLEDIYLPFKPKRQNPAAVARDSGLEPLALEILEGKLPADKLDERSAEFINEDKHVKSVADVLLGTGHIIADMFGCRAELVHKVRDIFYQHGYLTTTKIGGVQDKKESKKQMADSGIKPDADKKPATESIEESANEAGDPQKLESAEAVTVDDGQQAAIAESANETGNPQKLESEEAATAVVSLTGAEGEEGTEGAEGTAKTIAPETSDATQEVTELFQQLQTEQAEKGLPTVKSQNAIKKKKKAEKKKKLNDIKQRQRDHFERQFSEYFDYSIKMRGIPAHRILAINRGERHKILQVALKVDETKILESVRELCVPNDHPFADFLTGCLQDALRRSVVPMLMREIRNDMTEYAEKNVLTIFGQNLRSMLLQHPLSQKRVVVLDPGHKDGCKVVALDEFGNLVGTETIFFTQNLQRREVGEQALAELIRRLNISVIGIGIGNGSRPIEEAVVRVIETYFADSDLAYTMVRRAGSLAYAASPAAKDEFPNEDAYVRAAVFLGRCLQNPITELVKVDPMSLGQIMYQHEVRGKYVEPMLAEIVDSCVNLVGVDVNRATPILLTHIAGLNQMTARRICEYRREHGLFRTREDLKKVPGINEKVYIHAAGFLKIFDGENPLDSTDIHPESYELAKNILGKLGFAVKDLQDREKTKAISSKIASERIGELTVRMSAEFNAGLETVRDIVQIFAMFGRDSYELRQPLVLRRKSIQLENLTPGTELTGTILNVTDFGAFVDIGLHESGFIHVSQMASGYIQSAHERVISGSLVRLWVVEVDVVKKRVSLTLLPPGTERQTSPQKPADRNHGRTPRESRGHSARPPRVERERREFSEKPRGERPTRDSRDGKRFDRRGDSKSFVRVPKTFVTAPIKKEVKPITEKMKQGKEPMRSFGDLAQLFGRAQADTDDGKKDGKK